MHPFGHLLDIGSRNDWSLSIGEFGHNCGVCISIGSIFVASMLQHGILVSGWAMYVLVRIVDATIFFLLIYASLDFLEALRCVISLVDS